VRVGPVSAAEGVEEAVVVVPTISRVSLVLLGTSARGEKAGIVDGDSRRIGG